MFVLMWRVLTRPSLATFESMRAGASFGRAITYTLAIGFIVGALRGSIHWFFSSHPAAEIVTLAVMTAFSLLASLIVAQAFLLSVARALGGRGDFASQIFLSSLAYAPLNALAMSADVFHAKRASPLIVFVAVTYSIVLVALALRAAHGGTAWRVSNIVLIGLSFIGGMLGWLVISSIPQ